MKRLRLFKPKKNEFEELGVKYAVSSTSVISATDECMCDHQTCETKCSCTVGSFAESAWTGSGRVDSAVKGVGASAISETPITAGVL